MTENIKEIEVLENIYQSSPGIRQRDLAEIAGVSLGMTNAILKRLAGKGFLTIKRINNRNIHYVVTSSGIEAITRKSYRYFKRTIKNVVYYKEAIENLIADIKKQGYEGVVLKGPSDLDFIVEHACGKNGLRYIKKDEPGIKVFLIYSESYLPHKEEFVNNCAFLQSILI